jgi:hypothetical protein
MKHIWFFIVVVFCLSSCQNSGKKEYQILIEKSDGADLTANVDTARAGDTIRLELSDYDEDYLTLIKIVLYDGAKTYQLDDLSFTMPKANVTIRYEMEPKDRKKFYSIIDTKVMPLFRQVEYWLLANGTECDIYCQRSETAGLYGVAKEIAKEFDEKIYTIITTNFGEMQDTRKIIIAMLDINKGYEDENSYIAGYFMAQNEFSKTTYSSSNEAHILYLDVGVGIPGSKVFYSTIAHEFQHMVGFNNTVLEDGWDSGQDTWIDEGLSSAAEYLYIDKQVEGKIAWYNGPDLTESKIFEGSNFFKWGSNGHILDSYSTVYLFFQWLRIHSNNGIYKKILTSREVDYRAVTSIAKDEIHLDFSDWTKLMRTWQYANFLNHASNYMGYKGEIQTKGWYVLLHNDGWYVLSRPNEWHALLRSRTGYKLLAPGEGMFAIHRDNDVAFNSGSGNGPNIVYAGIKTDNSTIETSTTNPNAKFIHILNKNPNNKLSTESINLPVYSGTLTPPASAIQSRSVTVPRQRMPIDLVIKRDF